MNILIWNLLLEPIFDFGKWSNWKYAKMDPLNLYPNIISIKIKMICIKTFSKKQLKVTFARQTWKKNLFFVNSVILGIHIWRKKGVNDDKFEIAKKKQRRSVI